MTMKGLRVETWPKGVAEGKKVRRKRIKVINIFWGDWLSRLKRLTEEARDTRGKGHLKKLHALHDSEENNFGIGMNRQSVCWSAVETRN